MSLDTTTRERIDALLTDNRVVLFMKGEPGAPRCGFSAKASGILSSLGVEYAHVDVLSDGEIREGIKLYGSWPTIPQLYIDRELVGGSDIIEQMLNDGQLHEVLGLQAPDRTPPAITITETAAEAINRAMAEVEPGMGLHLGVDPNFNAQFQLAPVTGSEIVSEAEGIRIHFDLVSAPRANGIEIDWVEDVGGAGLRIRNPNAPPPVQPIQVEDAKAKLDAGELVVVDVRPAEDRRQAAFPGPHEVLDEDSHDRLAALDKQQPLAFLCHHGISSRRAAEHFRGLGFRNVFNVEGGIDAWAQRVDTTVPRY
ncbi:Grx4 family monothiol glutaredoxin [Alkalisalibacterium limincola]|uniref:Grx4 family monothiol glutaredoxin n=1 Tax=Alkalisalibacterium limincola TaxID=2699169 RepID=A0A5C8KYG4_9GAMM|nr:Grx4 family monothiol glutaredoxin [Alkalisalibacterium limincola]TXK64903.1 Grx4 family monothiol glutaredoxin [Alkalisalibacterium limincola]